MSALGETAEHMPSIGAPGLCCKVLESRDCAYSYLHPLYLGKYLTHSNSVSKPLFKGSTFALAC